jgi:hypothetical protein
VTHLRMRILPLIGVLTATFLLTSALPVYAQQPSNTIRQPDGLEVILGLIGIGIVVLIGFVFYTRSSSNPSDDED